MGQNHRTLVAEILITIALLIGAIYLINEIIN